MKKVHKLMVAILIVFSLSLNADEWVTDDGLISLQVPSGENWIQRECPSPAFLLLKFSKDERSKICIFSTTNPTREKLILESLAKGAAKEVNGEIVSTDMKIINNVEVFEIIIKSNIFVKGEMTLLHQRILQLDKVAYKVMATYPEKKSAYRDDINTFMNSLKVLKSVNINDKSNHDPIYNFSKRAGGIGLFILLTLGLILFLKKKKNSKNKD